MNFIILSLLFSIILRKYIDSWFLNKIFGKKKRRLPTKKFGFNIKLTQNPNR